MVAVFHRIGEPSPDLFTHSIEQIIDYTGQVTFDGVYESVFDHRTALPGGSILFISGNQIGRDGFCNKEQLYELSRLGHRLAWHGWSHRRLTEMTEDEVVSELQRPHWVEPLYAYPHGDFNQLALSVLSYMGYERAYSTTQGIEGSQYAIPRRYV